MDTPCQELQTTDFINIAQELVTKLNNPLVAIKVIKGDELRVQGFGGIYGVGKGAIEPPALVVLSYTPKQSIKTIAMVGKGIVYDTGGLSIKNTAGMCGMKHDKGGACAILNAFKVL
jgi:probable aminopeptidase NPEPL1